MSPTSFSGFVVLNYTGPATLALAHQGSGGVSELVALLQDDQVQYCVVRVPLDRGSLKKEGESQKTRDVFIQWSGPRVGQIEKGKKKAHVGAVQRSLPPTHATLFATSKRHFTEDEVIAKSDPLSGSHELTD